MDKKIVLVLASITLVFAFSFAAVAAEFPTKPITLVIQYPAGGSTDLTGRALANGAKKFLGQPVICENKPGGGGTVGVALTATKPPDGYTLGIITSSPTMAYHMGKFSFSPVDGLTHVIRWSNYLFGIVVRADAPWKTMQELMQYIKQNPKKLTYGTPGVGTPPHLAMEELSMVAGIQLTHMPYKGIAENNAALLGGHIDLVSDSSGFAPLVDAGKFRLLATWGEQRCTRYPQVPTIKEIGYNVVARSHLGVIGPKGIPKPIVARLHDAFKKALDEPEFIETQKKFDMNTYYLNSDDYTKYMKQDFEDIKKLVTKLGLNKQ